MDRSTRQTASPRAMEHTLFLLHPTYRDFCRRLAPSVNGRILMDSLYNQWIFNCDMRKFAYACGSCVASAPENTCRNMDFSCRRISFWRF